MQSQSKWITTPILALLVCILIISACSPAAPKPGPATAPAMPPTQASQATATLPPAATATQAVVATNTAVLSPTATLPPPTETPQPSATPQPAVNQDGFSAWCLPEKVLVSAADDPLNPPAKAEIGKIEKDAMEIRNWPWSVCVFLYTFNQAAPTGLKLEIYDLNQKTAWLKTDLTAINGKPSVVFTRLRHTYIINAPLWNVSYDFVLRDSNGAELRKDRVNLHRWITGLCWQQTYPDPITLYCPLQQDLHPWDPGYGKKLPTVTPIP